MTDDASPENLRKFLESDDPALTVGDCAKFYIKLQRV